MPKSFSISGTLRIMAFHRAPASPNEPVYACHLIVTPDKTVLLNCHDDLQPGQLTHFALPQPDILLATHIDQPISHQGKTFPAIPCLVPQGLLPLALDPALAQKATTWNQADNWEKNMGKECWGVAGSRKYDPPAQPIPAAQPIRPGDTITLHEDTQLKAFALPFHGEHSLGFQLIHKGAPQALFVGTAMQWPGQLTQVYTFERNYGFVRFNEVVQMLDILAKLETDLLLPSQGESMRVLSHGVAMIPRLQNAIRAFLQACAHRPEWFQTDRHDDGPEISGYHQRAPGVYQMKKHGNAIVLIDNDGHGLIVDPGPCGFDDPNRIAAFHKQLDGLHAHAGLRNIDTVLITHFHGDHVDLTGEIKTRYPGARACAWGPIADIIQNPYAYPYACRLPWYGLPHKTTPCDHAITKDNPLSWHGRPITPIYTPGHAKAHAAYLIDFAGHRIAFTGDSIQTNGELPSLQCIPCNDSVLGGDSSIDISYRNLINQGITLNLGGHGSWFTNCDYHYKAALERFDAALPLLVKLFPKDTLPQAFRPRWFPELHVPVN